MCFVDVLNKIIQKDINDQEIIRDVESLIQNYPCYLSLLTHAVCSNRKELVEYILTYPYPGIGRSEHASMILRAAYGVPVLKILLDIRDINVNTLDWERCTALHSMCEQENEECVKELLLDARINTSIRNCEGFTARDKVLESEWGLGHPGIARILRNSEYTSLLRIPNASLLHDIVRMIIEEYA